MLIPIAVGWSGSAASSGAISLKLNFMNFVALPITLGVGADYAANIWARMRADGGAPRHDGDRARPAARWRSARLTTIIGYSSLLLSRNRALRSFGLLADIGEMTCLAAALVVLPALARVFACRTSSHARRLARSADQRQRVAGAAQPLDDAAA